MCIHAFLKGAIRDDLLDQSELETGKASTFIFIESKMSSSRSCTMILTASKEGKKQLNSDTVLLLLLLPLSDVF